MREKTDASATTQTDATPRHALTKEAIALLGQASTAPRNSLDAVSQAVLFR